ncbi:MAG TPA: DUF4097 family beta strand repeat-containing protein [Lacunisphaera sp.]|nr:DUF4097 family beta strand repeat-containing protein [Lacunisphaera sp.]
MKSFLPLLFLGVLMATPVLLPAKITRTVEKTFTVQPGGNLRASTQGGNITIKTNDRAEVHVLIKQTMRTSSEQEADDILSKLVLKLEQSGNDVTIESKYERSGPRNWFGNWPPVSVSFEITVPKSYNLGLNTSGGNISVESLVGNVHARTSGGNLEFARIEGDIDAGTSGGNITLQEGTAHARLNTSGGNIHVDRAGGPTEVSTSGGDIELRSVAQLISASTSGGDVHAVITEPLRRDTELGTSGGNVEVEVVPGAGFHLDAGTSGGNVKASGVTITLEQGANGKNKLVGAVNGGGPRLKLRTSGGDIVVRSK